MKRLSLVIVVLAMSLPAVFSQSWNKKAEPFTVGFDGLKTYLELSPAQMNAVYDINKLFVENQKESLTSRNPSHVEDQLRRVVYSNLSQMKSVLNADQYRKYVTLINVTNNNKGFVVSPSQPEGYLADRK